jgi:hypothetical protein
VPAIIWRKSLPRLARASASFVSMPWMAAAGASPGEEAWSDGALAAAAVTATRVKVMRILKSAFKAASVLSSDEQAFEWYSAYALFHRFVQVVLCF